MKKENKQKKRIIIITLFILLLIGIFLFIKFGINKKYTIIFNSNGGNKITNIEIKEGEAIKLPESPIKEGYTFVGWVNQENNVVTTETKIKKNITLEAIWVKKEAETITISFNTGDIKNIAVEKGTIVLLPVDPIKEGYIFAGWLNQNDNIVTEKTVINEDTTLKALWIKEGSEIKTVTFNADGGSAVDKIIIEKGKVIRFPINPIKEGYIFKGWIDGNGKDITKDTLITDDVIIKAIWAKPYTCPSDCIPNTDGSTCTKISTKELTTSTGCPSGYILKNNQCLDVANAYHATHIDAAPWWSCDNSSYVQYDDCYGGGCLRMCAKKANKVTASTCPTEYIKEDNICKKVETISCTAN